MKPHKALVGLAVLGLAVPGLAVQVQWSDFEVGTNYGLGPVGENLVAPAGYGPPSSYGLNTTIKTMNSSSQQYTVPPEAYHMNPDGEGWMIPDDGGGTFEATDWRQYVQDLGGPAPDPDSPCKFIADVRIDVDTPAEYDIMKSFFLSNAPSPTINEFDPLDNPAHNFGEWYQDFTFLETAFDGNGDLAFILILVDKFVINNPFTTSTANYYMDNLRIEYVPEPVSLVLFGLGGLALLRRRR